MSGILSDSIPRTNKGAPMNEGINAVIEDWSDMMYVAIPKITSMEPIILAKSGTDLPKNENASSIACARWYYL